MTHSIDRRPDWVPVLSIVPTLDPSDSLPLVVLKADRDNTNWELSIAGTKIGTVTKSPSFLFDETFEGNPADVFDCYPYGVCVTRAEAIGRLFAGWLVDQKIAESEIWQAEPRYVSKDYM
jgi:hypothetical protein